MNFQFQLNGTPIAQDEAIALLSAVSGEKEVKLDLASLIDLRRINSKSLFEMAVQNEQPELANLAWKISVAKTFKREPKEKKGSSIEGILKQPKEVLSVEQVIEKLNQTQAYWAAGAALLLSSIGTEGTTTLRQIAIDFADWCYSKDLVPDTSVLFRGFELRRGRMEPVDFVSGVDRRKTFHVAPLYIGLREGLLFCQHNQLVEVKNSVSTNNPNAGGSGKASHLSRVFYKVKGTEKGVKVQQLWADAEDYVVQFFRNRLQ